MTLPGPPPAPPTPTSTKPEDRLRFGPSAFIRKLTRAQVDAKIRASKIDLRFFEIIVHPAGVGLVVRARAVPECMAVLQQIANEDGDVLLAAIRTR